MADRPSYQRAPRHEAPVSASDDSLPGSFLRKLHEHAPNSSKLLGLLTLVVSGGILLLITGLTVTVAVTGLIFVAPLLILTSPLWVPMAAAALGLVSVVGMSWMYKYMRGSETADHARERIYDTARFLQSKLKKDVAPGA